MSTTTIKVTVSDEKHAELVDQKGERTWLEVLEDGAAVKGEP